MFTDRDVSEDPPRVAAALEVADAFFASLVFDFDNVRRGRANRTVLSGRLADRSVEMNISYRI